MAIAILAQGKSLELERADSCKASSTAVVCKKSKKKNKTLCSTTYHCLHCLPGLVGGISLPTIVLVYKKRAWGVIGPYLKSKRGAIGNRIARLRENWSARGRELDYIKHLPDS